MPPLGGADALMWALAVTMALAAPAHSRSEGASRFSLDDSGRVAVEINLSELDLPELCNVDFAVPDLAHEEAELTACLERGLARWLRLSGDGRGCPVAYLRWARRERTVAIEADALCVALPRQLIIDWGLFAGGALDHVSVAMIEQPHAQPRLVMLSRRAPRFVLEVARPWWPFALAGGAALLLAAALCWWALRRRRA